MRIQSLFSLAGLAAVAALLAGCGATPFVPTSSSRPAAISGKVHGGQQPVAYSTIQLYTVGTSQDGSPSSPLLNTSVQTDADGNFNITHDYSCSSATQVYITSTGGYVTATQQNPNLVLMAALGPCSSLGPNTSITINELTTVAAVNALYPFMTSATAIGSGSSDVAALNAGFTLAGEFVNTATGLAPGAVPAGFTAPTDTLNTLADAMANCINSPGGTANDNTACGNFFGWTTPPGETPPTDTVTALLYLAQNPTLSTNSLWKSATPSAPFQPTLMDQPANFVIALSLAPTASLTLSPSSLTFGTLPVSGTTPLQVAALTNTGTIPVAINSLVIAGTNTADFAETTLCPALLYPGNYCTIQTTFSPTAAGSRSASLQINGGALSTTLSGTGETSSAATPTLSVTNLYFGAAGQQQLVTLTNYDSNPLGIKSIKFGTTQYAEVDNCNGSLSGQSVCNIYVTGPPAAGSYNDTMTITDSAGAQTVSLITAGTYFVTHSFYPTYTQTFGILENTDLNVKNGSGFEVYGGFIRFTNPNANLSGNGAGYGSSSGPNATYGCEQPVPSCDVYMFLGPSGFGYTYDYGTDTAGKGYLLAAFGTYFPGASNPTVIATPLALNYGNAQVGQSSQLTLTVTNDAYSPSTGNVPFIYSGVTFSGPEAAEFTLASTTCSRLNNVQDTCNVVINFTPQAAGIRSATVTVAGSALTASSLLTGVAYTVVPVTTYPSPTPSPTTLTFPSTAIGDFATPLSTTVTMPNLDPASATITGTGFSIYGGTTCAQGASTCQFSVTFAPTSTSPASGSLTITDTLTNNTATVALSGTVTTPPPVVSLSPTSLTFSPRSIGQQSLPQTITLTNTGGSPLVISAVTLGGTNPGDYAMNNGCSGTIAVNGNCTISVTNDPTFSGGSYASITIVTNASSSPNVVNLSGTGQ